MSHYRHDTTAVSLISSLPLSPGSFLVLSSLPALSFSHTPPPAICPPPSYPPPSHLLRLSQTDVISLSICHLLPVPLCSFRFNIICTFVFPYLISSTGCISAYHLWTYPLVSIAYVYLLLIWISFSFSPCMPICVYLLPLPSLGGLGSHEGGAQKEGWTRNGKLFISDSSAAALSTTQSPLKQDEGGKVREWEGKPTKNKSYSSQ